MRQRVGEALTELDVAIVGGGLAGSLLARQLHRRRPDLRIGLFEESTGTSYKVGEATVEIASSYLLRRQGLSSYLYENHLPKNGLRFFFDTPDASAPLERMSEIGSVNFPFHPAFQLDRARLEADLLAMNQQAGVQVRSGVRVRDIELGEGGAPHRFQLEADGRSSPRRARWLVDAAGRSGLLARPLGLRVPEEEHRVGSAWARFEDVTDIDDTGPESFHARVRHTARRLSTLHFWYPGYWIWFIPLRGGLTSVGVTGEMVARGRELRTPEGFRAFLGRHSAIAGLLSRAKPVDFGAYGRIAYGTRRFFHADRWGLTGEAATAADPLYSPGSDFIALENDFLTDLIVRDADGASRDDLAERCELYDRFMRFRHEAAMRLYRGLYGTLGSYRLAQVKWGFDIGCYYDLWVSSYLCDEHLDLDHLRLQLRLEPFVLRVMADFARLFRRVEEELHRRGDYFAQNDAGLFHHGLTNIDFVEQVGLPRSQEEVVAKAGELFNLARAQSLALLGEAPSPDSVEPLPLAAYLAGRALS
jgi:flavin-dependent dehydrogenase